MAAGAPCSALDDDGQCPLHHAIANGHIDAVERLTAKQPCAEMSVTDRYKMVRAHRRATAVHLSADAYA